MLKEKKEGFKQSMLYPMYTPLLIPAWYRSMMGMRLRVREVAGRVTGTISGR